MGSFDRIEIQNRRFSLATFFAFIAIASSLARIQADEIVAKSYPVLSGVGLAINVKQGQVFTHLILPKSPADESGRIKEGSQLIAIENQGEKILLDGKSVGEVASIIRGPVGTKILITFIPPGSETQETVLLERMPLELVNVETSTYASMIGTKIPDIELVSMDGLTKKKLSEFRGTVLVLDFWASWCGTCFAPVSKMQKIEKENPQWNGKVVLVAVTIDEDLARAIDVIKQKEWNRTQNFAADTKDLKSIGIAFVPVVAIIDCDGSIALVSESHAVDIEKEVEALLATQTQTR